MNEKDMPIILYLANNPNSTGKTITDETGLNESNVSKHLNKLKEKSIVDYKTCLPQDGKNYTGKCWYILDDPDTFVTLLKKFVGNEHLEDFFLSQYVANIELSDLGKIDQIVIDTIIDKLKTVQLVCNTFYFGMPLTNELNAILASDGVAAKLSTQRRQQISDVALNLSREKNQSSLTVGRFLSDLRILFEQAASSAEHSDS